MWQLCIEWTKWAAVVAALAGICGSPAPLHAQNSDEIDLAEITQRLTRWRNSFVNLRMVYEMRSLPTTTKEPLTEWPPPADPTTARLFCRYEWIWADHGLDLLERRIFHIPGGQRDVEVYNGPKGVAFRARYQGWLESREELKSVDLAGRGVGKPISSSNRVPMGGLYWAGKAEWLPELLSKWKWTVEGIEDVSGERCVRISAANPEFTDVAWTEILWLDLNHDCLVRRHLTPSIPDRRPHFDLLMDEFQQLENGIWFPKRCRLQMGVNEYENQLLEVTEAAVNQSLDLSRFNPPPPVVGTLVGNRIVTKDGVASGVNSPGTPPQKFPTPSGTPPTTGWIWWSGGFVCVSLALMAVSFWLSRRK